MAVTLKIDLNDNGQISVSGPIQDKVLCFGLLEAAKDAVREHIASEVKKQILAAHPLINLNPGGHRNA